MVTVGGITTRKLKMKKIELNANNIINLFFDYPSHEKEEKIYDKTDKIKTKAEIVNEEREEKPVAPATSFSSEETHGGLESTDSVLESSNEMGKSGNSTDRGEKKEGGGKKRSNGGASGAGGDNGSDNGSSDIGSFGQTSTKNSYDALSQLIRTYEDIARKRSRTKQLFECIVRSLGETSNPSKHGIPGSKYNFKRMLLRRYERKPISAYKTEEKQDIVLILDTSGSMGWWFKYLEDAFLEAVRRGDVTIYIAPNGIIEKQILPGSRRKEVNHDRVMKSLVGRTIIYIGDFDGADTPIELSQNNRVIWIAPEFRYEYPWEHNWTTTDKAFRGVFIRAENLDEISRYVNEIITKESAWIDPYEGEIFDEEEEEY